MHVHPSINYKLTSLALQAAEVYVSKRDLNVEIYALACVIIWLRSKCRENCSYANIITPKVYQIVRKKKNEELFECNSYFSSI